MKVLSLFDGISCGQVALQRASIPVEEYYASEIDKYVIQITQKNFPSTIQIGDVRNIAYKNGVLHTMNGDFNVGKIDLLIGGSPCQNFTFCGKREGMVTAENTEVTTLSHYLELKNDGFLFKGQFYLFWEYIRLLKEIRPKYFLLENVKMQKRWQKIITDTIGIEPIYNTNKKQGNSRTLYNTNTTGYSYLRYDEHVDNMTDEEYCDFTEKFFLKFERILNMNGVILYNLSYGKNNCSPNKLTRIWENIFVFCRKQEVDTFFCNKPLVGVRATGQKSYGNIFNYIEAKPTTC